ncbi:hypothetical protein G7Z17_g7525 [Cylindrodendrum hubeiense]|uniref:Uncharacterized protein n=1 Tax=Cylindrodendrum hubeiense TaxID=595255 RepID=A0A9P5H8W6_9HYPO|nr:hypothetical protein G7Z17_g7525 [Cylindrodendrum hubeiense]
MPALQPRSWAGLVDALAGRTRRCIAFRHCTVPSAKTPLKLADAYLGRDRHLGLGGFPELDITVHIRSAAEAGRSPTQHRIIERESTLGVYVSSRADPPASDPGTAGPPGRPPYASLGLGVKVVTDVGWEWDGGESQMEHPHRTAPHLTWIRTPHHNWDGAALATADHGSAKPSRIRPLTHAPPDEEAPRYLIILQSSVAGGPPLAGRVPAATAVRCWSVWSRHDSAAALYNYVLGREAISNDEGPGGIIIPVCIINSAVPSDKKSQTSRSSVAPRGPRALAAGSEVAGLPECAGLDCRADRR